MDNKEYKLSSYIDSLNNERKPKEHEINIESEELMEIFDTVKKVKSLKEPSMPEGGYRENLADSIYRKVKPRKWSYAFGATAAAAVLIVILNIAAPINKPNLVFAMEKAYKEIKAYHGILEVVETNAEGKSVTQSKIEVWADQEGRYYAKGLQGNQSDLITANDGQKKWQVQPKEKEVDVFAAFPDQYSFTFEIGKEIESIKSAVNTKVIGEEILSGRKVSVMEVTPEGGNSYKIWIDKETKMPLQKQTSMENSVQYKMYYSNINFTETIPRELLSYSVPKGFKEVNSNTDQVVSNIEEASKIAGFIPRTIKTIPSGYNESSIAIINDTKSVKISYTSQNSEKKIYIIQKKTSEELKVASTAILGKINNNTAEVQSPVQSEIGVFKGGGAYAGVTGLSSVRWKEDGIEYATVGNTSLEELSDFTEKIANGTVELYDKPSDKPKIEVNVNMEAEKGDQKNADVGHSPWKLDPVFVSQVFVCLKISPEGIAGDYPIKYEELKLVKNNGKEAVVEVSGSKTLVRRVYLERLIRQDNTGIWTVVGFDPAEK